MNDNVRRKVWSLCSSYELDRHGHHRKGCIPCKQRRESRKAKEMKAPPLPLSLPTDDEPKSPPHTPQKQPLDIHCSLKRVITPFVRNGVGGACLIASAFFIRLVGRGELIEGYLVRDRTRDHYCRHYWARVDNIDYDLGSAITTACSTRRIGRKTPTVGATTFGSADG